MHNRNISLNGLRAFESASRLLSFTAAARELNVTQAAVSQQIRGLENQLGLLLFERQKRGLKLTSAGTELALSTRSALSMVYDTLDRITGKDAHGVLTVSTLGSFASRWLIPRLAAFQDLHPDFDLHIHTSDENVDLFNSKVDVGIRFSSDEEDGICTELMMHDAACLVCSPRLAEQLQSNPQSMCEQTLIIDGNQPRNSVYEEIPELSAQTCLQDLSIDQDKISQLVFTQSDNVVQSALAGQGVALTQLTLCADEIEAGHLVILYGYYRPFAYGYSLVYPQYRASDARLVAFRKWVMDETKRFREILASYSERYQRAADSPSAGQLK